ncbi:hypothetical protein HY988_00785 [Candidatus Micrarchaeota archaeon]|nr:hypothetical protein [Candidatus Micrarchaeota archaeon]
MLLPLLLAITLPPAAWSMIFVSLGFATGLTGSIFLVAYFLQSPSITAIAKEELAALIFSAVIIFFWLSLDTTLNALVQGALQSSTSGLGGVINNANPNQVYTSAHINLALGVLTILKEKLFSQYIDLYLFEALIGFLSTVSFPVSSPIPSVAIISFSFAPFTGLTLLSDAHTIIVETISYLVTVLMAKEFILIFTKDAIPLIILPFGLILRAFPFYRTTGSSILAICFAMYFVLPFATIFSHYLIFSMYKPADFVYTPQTPSYLATHHDEGYWTKLITEWREGSRTDAITKEFQEADKLADATKTPTLGCDGVTGLLCSLKNMARAAWNTGGSLAATVRNIWLFMVGTTGDFYPSLFGSKSTFLPTSSSAGLYYFILNEVGTISPFIVLVILTTVLEIIITVTMYRSISMLIGGEAELVGLTKVV